jgi:predicted ATPase/DNA-binding CsgD family transcriptional regulator
VEEAFTMQHCEQSSLSPRQAEIAQLIVSGKSTREIALALTLSPRTIETHTAAIYNKYGVSSRAELIVAVLGPSAAGRASATMPAADAEQTNLPVRRGRLVGRAADIENIAGLLRTNQLVTLTGAGGIGKTQAALAVGEALLGEFGDGVWFVELAGLAHGSPVAEALARALNLSPAKGPPLLDAIVAHLQRKTVLLVVDNCEHVIGEVATLAATLMRRSSRLHVLATSREPLRIAGEQTYRLRSLGVPAREDVAGLRAAQGADYAAVELFTQRAQATDFRFVLDDDAAPIVAEICRKVDGIPLAIELAAARVKILSLGDLAAKIDSHLRILAGGDRLALPRHRTMHALIDWSYHLLAPAEQRLFERMSVFAGGCAFEEAAAVYGDEPSDGFAVLDLLSALVDKSLLTVDVQSTEPRYALLQSFGQYASEKLESRGESSTMRQRHAAAYTALAERLEEQYDYSPTAAWYARSEVEFENFSSALDWTLEARRDIVLGQRLAAALRPVWMLAAGGERWLRLARELSDERTPPFLAARLAYASAWAGSFAGDNTAALETSRRLITTYHELGDPLRAAYAQGLAAFSLLFLGRLAEAESLITPALEVARSHEHASLTAFLLRAGSLLSSLRGDVRASRAKLVEARAMYERIGAERLVTITVGQLAELEFQVGNVERAFELAVNCLNLQRAHRSRHITQALANAAAYSVALNRWDRARAYAREALGRAQQAQDTMSLMVALQHLAAIAVLSANGDGSAPVAAPFSAAATLARAALLLGFVDAGALGLGVAREYTEQQEYDRVLAALRAAGPADDLAHRLAQGAALTPDEAIEIALSV